MVANLTISKILRFFEKYLIAHAGYHLGVNYDLILLIPGQRASRPNYSWVVSAPILDNVNQKDFLVDVLSQLRQILPEEEHLSIARINKVNSQDAIVKNINFLYPFDEEITEVSNFQLGGSELIERGILLRSRILGKLKEGRAVTITLNMDAVRSGKYKNKINAGIISIDPNFSIKHWTGKGLRELFAPDRNEQEVAAGEKIKAKGETYLIENQYIAFTNLDDIEDVY